MVRMHRPAWYRLFLLTILTVNTGCNRSAPYEGQSMDELRNKLSSEDPTIRAQGAIGLGLAGKDAVIALADLQIGLKDSNPQVRSQAAVAIGQIGAEAAVAVQALIATLADPDILVRRQAIVALGRIGPKAETAIKALEPLTRDEAPIIANGAKDALLQIRGDKIRRKEAEKSP